MPPHEQGPAASPTVAPPAWARVRLIEGESPANMWHVDSTIPSTQLVVGKEDGCSWRVTAPGVAPQQFEFFWDGARLWIGDTQQTGGVSVDGAPFAGWQPLAGRARIEFGGAVMLAESSEPAVSVASPAFALATDDDDEPTKLAPRNDAGKSAPAQPASLIDLASGNFPRPRAPEDLPTTVLPKFPAPSSSAQTVVAKIYDRPAPAKYPGAPAGVGAPSPAVPSPPPARAGEISASMAAPMTAPAPHARFANTPPIQSKAPSKAAQGLGAVPVRTWLLGGVTAAALAVVLLMGGGDGGEAERGARGDEVATADTSAETPEPNRPTAEPLEDDSAAATDTDDTAAATDTDDTAAANDTAAATDTDDTAAATDTNDTAADEQRAAHLLRAGRRSDALAVYGELAARHPDRPVFAAIVTILERELAERCADSRSAPCNE